MTDRRHMHGGLHDLVVIFRLRKRIRRLKKEAAAQPMTEDRLIALIRAIDD